MRKRTIAWIVAGVGGTAALAGGIVVLVFWLTSGVVEAGETFLRLVGQGQYEEAYRSASPDFRAAQDLAAFKAAMQRARLDKYNSASWSSRRITNGRGSLRGIVATIDGGQILLSVGLVQIDGKWAVNWLRWGAPSMSTGDDL